MLAKTPSWKTATSSVRIAPRPMLKALSWLALIGQIESLASLLSNPLARAFASPQQSQERKEALPLPLAILASWERKVCAADCTHNLRITLGSFLLAAHTSMRFGDIQRIKIKEISLTQHALRGSCWATKTTKLGQPWACTLFGLAGRGAQSSWVIRWLESLSEAVTQSILARARSHHARVRIRTLSSQAQSGTLECIRPTPLARRVKTPARASSH